MRYMFGRLRSNYAQHVTSFCVHPVCRQEMMKNEKKKNKIKKKKTYEERGAQRHKSKSFIEKNI